MSRSSHRLRAQLLFFSLVAGVIVLCSDAASALPVRLRSEIAPTCSSSDPDLKYADLFADGNIAVQGSYDCRGAFIYDITNPDAPVLASWYNPGNNQQFLEAVVIGNRGYFGSGTGGGGVHIVNLTDPYHPVLLGVVDSTHGNAHNFIHEMVVFNQNGGTFLVENYNSLSTKTIKVINVTNPAAPVWVRDIIPTEPQWVHAMVIRGNRMFFSGWGNTGSPGRSEIYDISNITTQTPTLLGYVTDQTSSTGNNMHSAWPSDDGNWLYSCREITNSNGPNPGDLRVYDIHDPAHPLLVNSISMNALGISAVTPHNPVVMGNFLYISWYQAGLQVFNISNRANPIRVGQYDTWAGAFAPPAAERQALADAEPWDMICGSNFIRSTLPTSYDGAWAVYPYLGVSKVLIGDLKRGMLIVDTSLISSPARLHMADPDNRQRTNGFVVPAAAGSRQKAEIAQSSVDHPGDIMVPADYDGDGICDRAVFRPATGTWFIDQSFTGSTSVQFGKSGDIPVPADFDADGKTDVAVFRPSTGIWYIQQSIVGFRSAQWGMSGDKPLTGDYDGDGKADVAVWRPSNGQWYILPSASSIPMYQAFGQSGDRPVNADFDGNGVSDYAIYRPSTGFWYILDPSTRSFNSYSFGISEDVPVPADYDGDGRDDITVFRPSANTWFRINSSTGDLVTE